MRPIRPALPLADAFAGFAGAAAATWRANRAMLASGFGLRASFGIRYSAFGFVLRGSKLACLYALMLGSRSLLRTWFPIALWMGVIFFLSTDELSDQRTSRFIGPFLRWLNPGISDAAVRTIQYAVRKCGHLSEYAVLAILLQHAMNSTTTNPTNRWTWSQAGWALLLTALYACTDEFHQAFVPSRQATVWDVLIDTVGGGLGLLVWWVIGRWRKRW